MKCEAADVKQEAADEPGHPLKDDPADILPKPKAADVKREAADEPGHSLKDDPAAILPTPELQHKQMKPPDNPKNSESLMAEPVDSMPFTYYVRPCAGCNQPVKEDDAQHCTQRNVWHIKCWEERSLQQAKADRGMAIRIDFLTY